MTSRGRDDEDAKGFLSRWSQRKQAAEAGTLPEAAPPGQSDAASPEADAGGETAAVDPAQLPDIDSLDKDSDFSVFLQQGVPRALQRRALRRLWQVDPLFQEICMLDDYNLDYTDAATVVPNLKTVYQVGRGMLVDEPEKPASEDAAEGREGREPGAGPEAKAPGTSSDTGREAASDTPTADTPAAAAGAEPSQKPVRKDLKPGTPRVSPPPTPPTAAARPAGGSPARSARQRRWGDSDAH